MQSTLSSVVTFSLSCTTGSAVRLSPPTPAYVLCNIQVLVDGGRQQVAVKCSHLPNQVVSSQIIQVEHLSFLGQTTDKLNETQLFMRSQKWPDTIKTNILWNGMVHQHVHRSWLLAPFLSEINIRKYTRAITCQLLDMGFGLIIYLQ